MKGQLPVYSTVARPLQERSGLRAVVDRVEYTPSLETPNDRPFAFIYFITVHNGSSAPVTLKGRKWIITESDGLRHVIEGDGIVGCFPRLAPGESFSYNSYHVVASDSRVEGMFLACDDLRQPILVRVPGFTLNVPV